MRAVNQNCLVFEISKEGRIINYNSLFIQTFSQEEQGITLPSTLEELYQKFHLYIPIELITQLEVGGKNYTATLHFQDANNSIQAISLLIIPVAEENSTTYLCIGNITKPIKYTGQATFYYCNFLPNCYNIHNINHLEEINQAINKSFITKAQALKESIQYAERIQRALIPSKKQIDEYLPKNFEAEVWYEPKDTISGDFYWVGEGKTGSHFMVGDSTGHGVPGALLSMLGVSSITKLIEERNIEDPARILTCLDNFWYEKLYKTVDQKHRIEDTLEAALCKTTENSNYVEIASAMLPVYVVTEKETKQIQGTKRPIGGSLYKRETSYQTHRLALQPGDTIYLFSDGFFSQLGNKKNNFKPIGKKRFRQWLREVQTIEELSSRVLALQKLFFEWKGDNPEQTDDIVLIALRYIG
ncbi:MAG: SpoIIE family protein phosphatase [Bacteroidia bacterium]|nr:serine/threonine-protein phosphatase [Bacteroidia bacterium]MDW8157463.1 SpoIIE family protein phosphatase [Bacteroidia bacterium]